MFIFFSTKLHHFDIGFISFDFPFRMAPQAQKEQVFYFVQECMKECKGKIIPFEALLHPSQVMPFALILVSYTCPHATVCVLIPLNMCPHTTMCLHTTF
jgi:hypothetical protein